jgi:predicted ABC-type ATPase
MAVAYLVGGGAASGKSRLASAIRRDNPHIVYVMPEDMDEKIPGFVLERDHEKSAHMTRVLIGSLIRDHTDMLCDYALAGEYDYAFIKLLVHYEYTVHLLFVDVPIEKAEEWAHTRHRQVPDNVIHDFHVRAARNFFNTRSVLGVDSTRLYDSSDNFKLVYLQDGWTKGIVYDEEKFEAFKHKATLESDGSGYHIFNTEADIVDLKRCI